MIFRIMCFDGEEETLVFVKGEKKGEMWAR